MSLYCKHTGSSQSGANRFEEGNFSVGKHALGTQETGRYWNASSECDGCCMQNQRLVAYCVTAEHMLVTALARAGSQNIRSKQMAQGARQLHACAHVPACERTSNGMDFCSTSTAAFWRRVSASRPSRSRRRFSTTLLFCSGVSSMASCSNVHSNAYACWKPRHTGLQNLKRKLASIECLACTVRQGGQHDVMNCCQPSSGARAIEVGAIAGSGTELKPSSLPSQ